MGWGAVLVLVAVQAISLCLQCTAAAGDGLPPVLAPITNGLCDAVECGKGRCKLNTSQTFGFVCECDPRWTKPHIGPYFQFLPCVIPNCTLDYSCFHSAMAPVPLPSPPPRPPSNHSLFDPCSWSHCGGGTCVRTSYFGYRCDCNPGFGNLLNITSLPCFRECILGSDCIRLGIVVPNGSSPSSSPSSPASPPSLSGRAPNAAATKSPGNLMWFSLLMAFLAIIPRT